MTSIEGFVGEEILQNAKYLSFKCFSISITGTLYSNTPIHIVFFVPPIKQLTSAIRLSRSAAGSLQSAKALAKESKIKNIQLWVFAGGQPPTTNPQIWE